MVHPGQRRRSPLLVAPVVGLLVVLLVVLLAACTADEAATFDPTGPCMQDVQQPGAYPELEAHVPASFQGQRPVRLDSGRNCSEANLGSLADHGVEELRFAGGLWETGERSGVSIALFQAPGLTVERMAEFYERGARTARKTEAIETSDFTTAGVHGWRLDTLNDESFQTIVVLEGPEPHVVRAVLVASDVREVGTRDAHEATVSSATATAIADR